MKSLPTFITERLILRAVQKSDIPSYQKKLADYEVIQHLARHVPWPFPDDGVELFLNTQVFPIQGQTKWLWGIFEKANPDELIGAVDLWREGKPEHRGFWLGKNYWGKGYMTEAVAPIMDYAFTDLGFQKLVFANAVENIKSGRVKEKTGATFVGKIFSEFVNPKYTKSNVYELKKENWKSEKNYFLINDDKNKINLDEVHNLLKEAYWCKGITKEILTKACENSLCFGVYQQNKQVGFARVITDKSTFAWLCDVIIDEKHQGKGLATELIKTILIHPDLQNLRRICLATKDAHELYKKFNFKVTESPQNWMEIKDNEIYLKIKE